jgi:hypothetical protein
VTDDLVKRLREEVNDHMFGIIQSPLQLEAADVIEKQREYIAVYQDQTNILLNRIEELEKLLEEKK